MGQSKLGGKWSGGKGLLGSVVVWVFKDEGIESSEGKGKEMRGVGEKVIRVGKGDELSGGGEVIGEVVDKEVGKKLLDEIGGKYNEGNGGYSGIVKLGVGGGEGGGMGLLELVK